MVNSQSSIVNTISVRRLRSLMERLLRAVGVRPADARAVAWVYEMMTLRGVGHHDVSGLPGLLKRLADGVHKPRPQVRVVRQRGAIAVMDGDNAPGPLAAYRMMEKAVALARRHGIGMVSMRNGNHFLGAAPYAMLAAEHDMIGLAASSTVPCMGTGTSRGRAIGNNPWGFAARTGAGFPFLLDICNAYASYGKLHEYHEAGRKIPREWGLDSCGRPTTDAGKVIHGGVPMPMADHKGFSMSILVEVLAGVLSGGAILGEISLGPKGGNGSCQAAIAIDIAHFLPLAAFRRRTAQLARRLAAQPLLAPRRPTLLPGQRSHAASVRIRREGVRLSRDTLAGLREWAKRLGVRV
jgi:LDH2 family malate/lactate/ureidoglycolate dehydrogenase